MVRYFHQKFPFRLPKNGKNKSEGDAEDRRKGRIKMIGMIGIIISIAAAVGLAFLISYYVPRFREFQEIFGFKPTGRPELKKLEQEKVDEVLKRRAGDFVSFAKWQQSLQGDVDVVDVLVLPDLTFAKVLKDKAKELREAEQGAGSGVGWAKRRFWRAHNAAKRKGYEVKQKHTDYL